MKLTLRTISNGLFLIFLGVVFLLLNYGVLGWGFWSLFLEFWPIVLIVVGLGLLFNRRVPVSLAFLVLGLVMVGIGLVRPPVDRPYMFGLPFWHQAAPGQETRRSVDFNLPQGLDRGSVTINTGGSELRIGSTGQGFVKGDVSSNYGNHVVRFDPKSGMLTVKSPETKNIARYTPDEIDLKLTDQIPLDLDINAGAISGDLDFRQLKLSELNLNLGAADVKMAFAPTGMKTRGLIKSGASSVRLVVPQDMGLRITFKGALANIDVKGRTDVTKLDKVYISNNFSTAQSSLDLELSMAVSNVEISDR